MRLKLFLTLLLSASLPSLAQTAIVSGRVINTDTGSPISGAVISIPDQGISVTTGPAGDFRISNARPGEVKLDIQAAGYMPAASMVTLYNGQTANAGLIQLLDNDLNSVYYEEQEDMYFDEEALSDEEGAAQSVAALASASDNIYYNAANYNFSPVYYRFRGYNSSYQDTYINGIPMNDLVRGGFTYSQLGGMTSRAFRNRTVTIGTGAAAYGFGNIGGSTNIGTITTDYSPGFNGSASFTNSNYMFRAMATYSTGLRRNGLAMTVSAIGRYANEGVVPGTFYNAGGFFISAEKVFNPRNSLTLTAYAAPMQYANGSASVQEVYDLVGDNLYNPTWGWQNGKKRSDNIREKFDPTVMLNYIYKNERTTVNVGAAARFVHFARTRLQYFKGNDPKPTYYKNLPSYWIQQGNEEAAEHYADLWRTDDSFRQIDWDQLYYINYLNNQQNALPENADNQKGSTYIQQMEHSNQTNLIFNTLVNHRFTDHMALQGGVSLNWTKTADYMTVRDLLGGDFWVDIDPFSDRDVSIAPDNLQNDLDNPNRKVYEGDRFGYDYNIYALQATAWLQNTINLPKWDFYYGMKMAYTQFYRYGHMRAGRDPEGSKGKGTTYQFDDATVKAGATYKLDGRNVFALHAQYGTQAPYIYNFYISPKYKATVVPAQESERIFSGDLSYIFNYRRFRGSITGYYTQTDNGLERTAFYDDRFGTFTNYVLTGVRKVYKGVEVGMAYKVTPSVTVSAAGTYSRYQYKNNPKGTRSFENGLVADTTQTVYLKNYFVGSTPQWAVNVGIDWAAPKSWFFNVNASWMGDSYVSLAPAYHEELPGLANAVTSYEELVEKANAISDQEKLKNVFVLNASIGKLLRINRKVQLNFNLSLTNILNNKDIVTNAYQQSRLDTKNWNPYAYPTRYQYAQGTKVFFNVGVRF